MWTGAIERVGCHAESRNIVWDWGHIEGGVLSSPGKLWCWRDQSQTDWNLHSKLQRHGGWERETEMELTLHFEPRIDLAVSLLSSWWCVAVCDSNSGCGGPINRCHQTIQWQCEVLGNLHEVQIEKRRSRGRTGSSSTIPSSTSKATSYPLIIDFIIDARAGYFCLFENLSPSWNLNPSFSLTHPNFIRYWCDLEICSPRVRACFSWSRKSCHGGAHLKLSKKNGPVVCVHGYGG